VCVKLDEGKEQMSLLTPWCRVLLEKLAGLQLVKKFPAFHGTRRFITALTSFRHLSLSWARPIQSIYPHPTFWRSILILCTHLRLGLPSGLFPSGFPTKNVKFSTVSNTLIESAGNKRCADWKSYVMRKKIVHRRDNRVPSITPKLYNKHKM